MVDDLRIETDGSDDGTTDYGDLTRYERDLLLCLIADERRRSDAPTGADVRELLEVVWDRRVRTSHFYTVLGDLVDDGLVEKRPDADDDRAYRYTATGTARRLVADRLELAVRLLDWVPDDGGERPGAR